MKATQLDSILRDYEHTEEQKAIMSDTISKKKDVCASYTVELSDTVISISGSVLYQILMM